MIDSLRFDIDNWQAWHSGFLTIKGTSEAFSAECDLANMRRFVGVSFLSSGQFTARSEPSGDGALCDTLALFCIKAGTVRLDIGGEQILGAKGDILLLSTAEPLNVHADDLAASLVSIPRPALAAGAHYVAPSPRILSRERESVGLLFALLDDIASRTIETAEGRGEAIEIAGACLQIACRVDAGGVEEQHHRPPPARSELVRLIDDQLADPQLNAATLAAQLGTSQASVYRHFASLGGLAKTIRNQRLDRALQDMASRAGRRENLDVVAARYGFSNRSVFSRAFTKRFGTSPIAIAKSSPDAGRVAARIARTLHDKSEPNLHYWMMRNTMQALVGQKAEV